jgi:hypothetical protein
MPSDGIASYSGVFWFTTQGSGVQGIVRKSIRRNAWETRMEGTSEWILGETRSDAVAGAVQGFGSELVDPGTPYSPRRSRPRTPSTSQGPRLVQS